MKALWSIVLVAAILAGLFGPPTPWPDSLDELYQFIDTGAPGWVFEGECGPGTLVTWAQVKQITAANVDGDAARLIVSTAELDRIGVKLGAAGTLDISEDELFGVIVFGVLGGAWRHGYQPICKPDGDKLGVYGAAADDILKQLEEYVR